MLKVRNNIKLAALLTLVGLVLGGAGESLFLAFTQLSIYLAVIWLIVRAK